MGEPDGADQHGFFFRSTPDARVIAFYPSPAGATESLLPLETWSEIAAANPLLQEMEADVEALLVNRIGHVRGFAAAEYYVLPIDECYKLVGLIRAARRFGRRLDASSKH
jgi:hypothetical protein